MTNTMAADGSDIVLQLDSEPPRSEAMRKNWRRDEYRKKRLKKMQKNMRNNGLLRKCTLINMFTNEQRQFDTPTQAAHFANITTKKIYRCTQGLSYGHKQYIVRYCEPTTQENIKYTKFDKVLLAKISIIDEEGPILQAQTDVTTDCPQQAQTNVTTECPQQVKGPTRQAPTNVTTECPQQVKIFNNMFHAIMYLHETRNEEMSFYEMFLAIKRSGTYKKYMISKQS